MRAITINEPGGPDVLQWTEAADPECGAGEVIVDVAATAVNRADLLQRQGFYPPPPGASEILGLECSGVISQVGADVDRWRAGDEVCALLAGGGYAERVAVPAQQVLPVPSGVDLQAAAGLPEVACTVWSNLVMLAGLSDGDTVLIHGGAGGIGTHAIQVAKALGAAVAVTAGDDERLRRCRELGADVAINYNTADFVDVVRSEFGGVDVILDVMGAKYLDRNVDALASNGTLVIIGLQGGRKAELNLAKLLGKRANVSATALRSRPVEEKAAIVADVRERLWPLIEASSVVPVIDRALPLPDAAEAHRALDAGGIFGKILLTVDR